VLAEVRLDASLVRSADDSVVWSGTARVERLVAQPTMQNVVAALSATAVEVVSVLAADARAALAVRPALSTTPPRP
jgi:hypothetical protein